MNFYGKGWDILAFTVPSERAGLVASSAERTFEMERVQIKTFVHDSFNQN